MAASTPFPVVVHPFASETSGSCAYERGTVATPNALVVLGGLTDGPHSSNLVATLAEALTSAPELGVTVWEFRMRSSYTGFGFSSLANDVEDISALVKYLRHLGKKKIVLIGHSTGCQDCLEYTNHAKYNNPSVDGYILVSPVSDVETAEMFFPKEHLDATLSAAQKMIADGKQDEMMPRDMISAVFASPVTAYRGDDDYFSSYLTDDDLAKTFGRVDKPILIMPSGKDELVPPTVDKELLLRRWMQACPAGLPSNESGVSPDSDHVVSDASSQEWLAKKVVTFLGSIV